MILCIPILAAVLFTPAAIPASAQVTIIRAERPLAGVDIHSANRQVRHEAGAIIVVYL